MSSSRAKVLILHISRDVQKGANCYFQFNCVTYSESFMQRFQHGMRESDNSFFKNSWDMWGISQLSKLLSYVNQSHIPVSPVTFIVFGLYPTFLQNRNDMMSNFVNFTIVKAWRDTIGIKPSLEFKSQGKWIFKNQCLIISPFTNFMSVIRKGLNSVTNQYGDVKFSLCSLGFSAPRWRWTDHDPVALQPEESCPSATWIGSWMASCFLLEGSPLPVPGIKDNFFGYPSNSLAAASNDLSQY